MRDTSEYIKDFCNMSIEVQEDILNKINNRRKILAKIEYYTEVEEQQKQYIKGIREECEHPLISIKKYWDEDEYGKTMETGYTEYICPDCGYRYSVTF